jgi:hypothetical protein
LVELPNEVNKIQAFREGVSHPGWHAPVTLILDNSFVVINSDSGILLRTFQLPADRGKIVDCKYIASEKSFLVATDDSYLMIIPDGSKTSSEYFQQKWPVRIKELVLVGEKSVTVVSDNDVACVRIEQNRVSVPNYAAAKAVKKANTTSIPPFLKRAFSSCGKVVRITAQSKIGAYIHLWEEPLPETASSSILTEDTVTSSRLLEEIQLDREDIKSLHVDPAKQCVHCIITPKPEDSVKKGNHQSADGSRWIKYDLAGNVLFERKLSFAPTFSCLSSDRLWLLTDTQDLTSWSARYGTLLQSLSVVAPIGPQLCELVHLEGDQGNYSLLYGLTNRDGQATTIFRYDVGGVSTAPVSLAALVGSHSKRNRDTFLASEPSSVNKGAVGTASILSSKLYHDVLREEMDSDKVFEYFSQDKNKRRKISKCLPLSSTQIQGVLGRYADEAGGIEEISEDDWVQLLTVIRLGVFSVQGHRGVWQKAVEQQRFDVLSDMIRFAVDINEFQVAEILQLVFQASDDTLANYVNLGGNLVNKATQSKVLESLSAAELEQWSELTAKSYVLQKNVSKVDDDHSNKKSGKKSKKDTEATNTDTANPIVDGNVRMDIVRAVVESLLYRALRFSPMILSEALQRLSISAAQLIMRMLVFSVFDMVSSHKLDNSYHCFSYLGPVQLLAAIEWLEAILDSHFTSFLFEAPTSLELKRCLQALVHLVKNAENAIEAVENVRGLWCDIERSLTRQGVQPRVDPGLYTVEVLRL